jgi:hypothetical protein
MIRKAPLPRVPFAIAFIAIQWQIASTIHKNLEKSEDSQPRTPVL